MQSQDRFLFNVFASQPFDEPANIPVDGLSLICEKIGLESNAIGGAGIEPRALVVGQTTVGAANPDLSARLALLLAESADPGAEMALRDAIRASPAPRADLHVALGEDLAAGGRSQEARQQFELAAGAPVFSDGTGNARAMALMQLGRADEAEDLVQSALGIIMEKMQDRPDLAWCLQVLRNVIGNHYQRRRSAESVAVEDQPLADGDATPLERLEAAAFRFLSARRPDYAVLDLVDETEEDCRSHPRGRGRLVRATWVPSRRPVRSCVTAGRVREQPAR